MNPDQTGQGIKSSPDSEAIGNLTAQLTVIS